LEPSLNSPRRHLGMNFFCRLENSFKNCPLVCKYVCEKPTFEPFLFIV
jgi:hypothetical protein